MGICLINKFMTKKFDEFYTGIIEGLKFNPVIPKYYDVGWKAKMTTMSPQKFLSLAARLPSEYYENCPRLDDLKEKIKNELPMDVPLLYVDMKAQKVTGHEGRHRAKASLDLGIEEIPVCIVTGSCYPRVPKWTEKEIEEFEKIHDFKPEL